ncbi:hypothetical protein [Aquimarina aquimarini]|uniref:hypothetical protein n=1 Tax=Aquimarina aquimarini TaxID=1191734 RepID=UPI001F2D0E88|nr:hypothetical protein [Aquimarina aquimarini]
MNKYNFFITLLFLVFANCKPSNDIVSIKVKAQNNPIVAKFSKQDSTISFLKFPMTVSILNKKKNKIFIKDVDYIYKNAFKSLSLGSELFTTSSEGLRKINDKSNMISSKENKVYINYSRHYIDTSEFFQGRLKEYSLKMLSENKDTLHIGTVKEFKAKHAELFNKLTKNDSISIQFLDGKELGERITVPVKW